MQNIWTIHASYGFADNFVQGLIHRTRHDLLKLSQCKIFVPNRRSVEIFQDAFIRLSANNAIIIPKIMPLGEDWDDLIDQAVDNDENEDKTTISPIKKRFILWQLIQKLTDKLAIYANLSPKEQWQLTAKLAGLIDELMIEGIEIKALSDIKLPEQFAEHWADIQEFLKIIGDNWHKILMDENIMDTQEFANWRINKLAQFYAENPTDDFIIVAGSTGSRPMVRKLMKSISQLPNGMVILPGFNKLLSPEEYEYLAKQETIFAHLHPQKSMIELLQYLQLPPDNVLAWHEINPIAQSIIQRQILLNEVMRPAEFSDKWLISDHNIIKSALENIHVIEANNASQEAHIVALIAARELNETTNSIMIIVHNQTIDAMVRAALLQLNINISSSMGQSLLSTPKGIFISQILRFIHAPNALNFLAVIKNSLWIGNKKSPLALDFIDEKLCRDQNNPDFFNFLLVKLKNTMQSDPTKPIYLESLAILLEFQAIIHEKSQIADNAHFREKLIFLRNILEKLLDKSLIARKTMEKFENLWQEISENTKYAPKCNWLEFQEIIMAICQNIYIYPNVSHPRLKILTPIESRNQQFDTTIICGLEEGIFPANTPKDPWFSRKMRLDIGLRPHEFSIAQSAHDFTTNLLSTNIYLTRAVHRDGAITILSRWLERLYAIARIAGHEINANQEYWLWCAHTLKSSIIYENTITITRPMPNPALALRPSWLSVSDIEIWLQNPYSIFAKKICNLRKLPEYRINCDNQLRGTLFHQIFQEFCDEWQKNSGNAHDIFDKITDKIMQPYARYPIVKAFWLPNLMANKDWFLAQIQNNFGKIYTEIQGDWRVSDKYDFSCLARADRIDLRAEQMVVIDYKTYEPPNATKRANGEAPQIPLTALILKHGLFSGICENPNQYDIQGEYWFIAKNPDNSEIINFSSKKASFSDICHEVYQKLLAQIEAYYGKNPQEYIANPAIKYNDYAHLSREAEWHNYQNDLIDEEDN